MPAVQYDYDYYEYRRKPRSSANAVTSKSVSKTTGQNVKRKASSVPSNATNTRKVVNRTNASRKTSQTKKTPTNNQKIEVKTTTTRNVTRTSTRAVTRDNVSTTKRRKTSSNNIEIPTMVSKKQIQKPKEMSLKKAQVVTNKTAKKNKTPLKDVAVSFFAFSILFLICYRSSLINESFSKLNSMKSELENIRTSNAQIESDIQTQTDLSNIEAYAKYQLGMQKPKDSQIQKVVINKKDKIATPVVIEDEEKTFFEKLINDIRNILD